MSIQVLSIITATENLSVIEQCELIAAAQAVPLTIVIHDGVEQLVYGRTPASDAALERLTTAFLPALHKAARAAKVLDPEDAFGVALAEFVAAVRRHDPASGVPFSATISTVLFRAVADADRTSDLITVRENVAARYWRLMHKHDHNLEAAYAECRDTRNGFDPATFLAVHRAIGTTESLDLMDLDGTDCAAARAIASPVPGPEEQIVQIQLVAWLLALVSDRQEAIVRLRYGFADHTTENLRLVAGYRAGEDLSDVQVAHALITPRPTVQREKSKALSTMRAALQDLINEAA